MRNEEVCFVNEIPQLGPHLSKCGAVSNIVPGQTVDVGENELLPWWPYQLMIGFGDTAILDERNADGASAVTPIVGSFEIDCGESTHEYVIDSIAEPSPRTMGSRRAA